MDSSTYKKNWDVYAKAIDNKKDAPEWSVLRNARESHWREFFFETTGKKVLDAGCGNGDYTVFAMEGGASVSAFDFSEAMVETTGSRLARRGLKVEALYRGSVTEIPHGRESFDVVFCLAVLDHLPEIGRVQALCEIYRVLKPGGLLYLDVPNRLALHWRLVFNLMRKLNLYPGGKIHFFLPWELKSLVRDVGFEPLESMGLTFCPPFSGIYTTNLTRITFLPEFLISPLDALYLMVEETLRRVRSFKPICWHYFLKSKKLDR